jgi:hypothetical protein
MMNIWEWIGTGAWIKTRIAAPLAETGIPTTVTKDEAHITAMMIAITTNLGLVDASRFALNTQTVTSSAITATDAKRCRTSGDVSRQMGLGCVVSATVPPSPGRDYLMMEIGEIERILPRSPRWSSPRAAPYRSGWCMRGSRGCNVTPWTFEALSSLQDHGGLTTDQRAVNTTSDARWRGYPSGGSCCDIDQRCCNVSRSLDADIRDGLLGEKSRVTSIKKLTPKSFHYILVEVFVLAERLDTRLSR